MLCPKCNSQSEDTDRFCGVCGASLQSESDGQPVNPSPIRTEVNFQRAVELGFKRSFEYRGRSTRPEFWWFTLFSFLVGILAGVLRELGAVLSFSGTLLQLAILIPGLSLGVRRLHDINKSGFWMLGYLGYFALFIPGLIWTILLMVWAARRSDEGNNKYGPPA